jgi:hypothetical protein
MILPPLGPEWTITERNEREFRQQSAAETIEQETHAGELVEMVRRLIHAVEDLDGDGLLELDEARALLADVEKSQ